MIKSFEQFCEKEGLKIEEVSQNLLPLLYISWANDCYCEAIELKKKNDILKEQLKIVTKFSLDICGHDDCAGDYSVGLSPCDMWQIPDVDDDGNWTKGGCILEMLQKELNT